MSENCVFCDRTKFEDRIVGETELFWVIATLGQITDGGYVLIVPKRHTSCLGALSADEMWKLNELWITTFVALEIVYQRGTVMFEHGIVGQTVKHAHLHMMPASCNIEERIARDFPGRETFRYRMLRDLADEYRQRNAPYLLWTDLSRPGSAHVVCWDPPAPAQYLRIAVAEALGRPERANWRTMDHELDLRLWSETVRRLAPHYKKP